MTPFDREDLPFARVLVQGSLYQHECVVVVDGSEVARLPLISHHIDATEENDFPLLVLEIPCYDHTAAGGLPSEAELEPQEGEAE